MRGTTTAWGVETCALQLTVRFFHRKWKLDHRAGLVNVSCPLRAVKVPFKSIRIKTAKADSQWSLYLESLGNGWSGKRGGRYSRSYWCHTWGKLLLYQCLLLIGRGLVNENAQPQKENSRLSVLISAGLTGHNNGLRIIYCARRLSRSFSHTANERRR